MTGEGTLRRGVVGGRLDVSVREGRLDDAVRKLLLEGISVDVEVADIAARRTEREQVFTWRSGRYEWCRSAWGGSNLRSTGDQLRVNNAAIDVFGGELRVGSLVMSTSRPEFSVIAQMNGVAVEQILFLLPPMFVGGARTRRRQRGAQARRERDADWQWPAQRCGTGETADLRLAVKPAGCPPACRRRS